MRSVILKFFDSDISEKNARGPVNVSNPALPIVPQAGRANAPEVGRANVQVSKPTLAGVTVPAGYASGATGVK